MEKVYMQITSGRGPAECCRVVALVLEKILKQAAAKGVKTKICCLSSHSRLVI